MNVVIISSSRDEISDYYKSIARSVSNFLAKDGCNLLFGGSTKSMMGISYDEFHRNDREITAVTVDKYKDDLLNMELDNSHVFESTFGMKKSMHNYELVNKK